MLRAIKITLTPQQKLQLEKIHNSIRDGRRYRIKAVLLASKGWMESTYDYSRLFVSMNRQLFVISATTFFWKT